MRTLDLFGEPEPAPAPARPVGRPDPGTLSVTELTRRIRDALESRVGDVWVEGEVSNFRAQSSGHWYFTLKDATAQISVVMFRNVTLRATRPVDGQRVALQGSVSVYEPQGKYQIVGRRLQAVGEGDLQARFEALKRQLAAEGLFDPARKRPRPAFPRHVVLVTSPTGAALRDMLNVLTRRAPQLRISVFPVRVQGTGAAAEIAAALDTLSRWHADGVFTPDTLVLARGGGSLEDLWCFNEEPVARALAACPVPTITGIGHEIDFTIADFVSDLRAPTPSAAAELLIEDRAVLADRVRSLLARAGRAAVGTLSEHRLHLRRLAGSAAFREPRRVIQIFQQRLDGVADALQRGPAQVVQAKRHALALAASRLVERSPRRRLRLHAAALRELAARLALLHPQRTLDRGFAMVRDAQGRLVRSTRQVPPGTAIRVTLSDGSVDAVTRSTPDPASP